MRNTANGEELRQFIERWERLEAEKKDIADGQKEVMAEAKSRGYDTAVIKALIAQRKKDPNDVAEFEAVLEMYQAAMGRANMAMLCDPDINMIQLTGRDTTEPSIRAMIYHYYDSMGMGSQKSRSFTDEYIKIQNEICQKSIASGKE